MTWFVAWDPWAGTASRLFQDHFFDYGLALEAYKRAHEPSEALCDLVDRLVSEGAGKNLDESYLELLTRLRRH